MAVTRRARPTRKVDDRATLEPELQQIRSGTPEPNLEFIMTQGWSDILEQRKMKQQIIAIAQNCRAYIKIPEQVTNKLLIWGTQEQCELAATQLDAWQTNLKAQHQKEKESIWQKINAYNGRKVHRDMQTTYNRFATQFFDEIDDSDFTYEAYLIWPTTYDFDLYLQNFESTALQEISTTFRCHFHHEKNGKSRQTRVRSQSEDQLLAAYQRLIGLAKEMISVKHRNISANYFLLPAQDLYRTKTKVWYDAPLKTFRIALHGDLKEDLHEHDWKRLVDMTNTKARNAAASALATCVQSLHLSKSHLRFRVEFGELGLKAFQRSSDGSNVYETDAFLEMVQNRRTRLSDCALASDDKDMFRLVPVLDTMPEFYQPEETFQVLYDFQEPDKESRIRLEVDLVRGYDTGETDIRGQRWLSLSSHGEAQPILDLKVLDLIAPSFAIQVHCHDLVDPAHVTKSLSAFQNMHKFRATSDRLEAFPKRQSIVPPGQTDLVTVTEITIYASRVKGMDGAFEVRREDVYDHRKGDSSPWPIASKWTARYYYLGWDSRLDEFANLEPGQDITWSRELTSLFPKYSSEEDAHMLLAPNFKAFWEEVRLIQGYLATALELLPRPEDDGW